MSGNFITTAIITKGLTCAPVDPCKSGIITTHFSLYCNEPPPPPEQPPAAGGGAYPYDAWNKFNPGEIQNFYQPVDMEQYYIVPRDQEAEFFRRRKVVKLEVKFGENVVTREFSLPEGQAPYVIKALSIANRTMDNMKVAVTSIKKKIHDIKISVSNLRRK